MSEATRVIFQPEHEGEFILNYVVYRGRLLIATNHAIYEWDGAEETVRTLEFITVREPGGKDMIRAATRDDNRSLR